MQASYLLAQAKLDDNNRKWLDLIDKAAQDAARINREIREILRAAELIASLPSTAICAAMWQSAQRPRRCGFRRLGAIEVRTAPSQMNAAPKACGREGVGCPASSRAAVTKRSRNEFRVHGDIGVQDA